MFTVLLMGCESGAPLLTEAELDLQGADKTRSGATVSEVRNLVLFAKQGVSNGFAERVEAMGGKLEFAHETGLAIVSGVAQGDLSKISGVSKVISDRVFQMELGRPPAAEVATAEDGDDPTGAYFYARQWNMRIIGADKAWAAGRLGSEHVTVAILDSGIDYLYPDLQGRVDLDRSVSFVPSDDDLVATYFPSRHPVTDLGYHGTHVAATVSSNAYLAAGVTSKVTLLGVKICSVEGTCGFGATIQGLLHAVDHGADVINMSLGGDFPKWIAREEEGTAGIIGYLNRIFNYANSKGVTVVVSGGNSATDLDHDGASLRLYNGMPNTVAVSASDYMDMPTSYTNFGRSGISVAAPGGSYVNEDLKKQTFIYAACSTSSLVIPVCQTGTYIIGMAGTSMAAPHVTGLAALLVEDVGRSPSRIKTRLAQGADDLGQPGTDPFYGRGRINVPKTLMP